MTKKITLSVFFATAMALITLSCNKERNMVNAIVVDTGDITRSGCGYLLKLDDQALLQPDYLPSTYQHEGLKVKIKYTHTGAIDTCAFGVTTYDIVTLQDIMRNKD
jgi:hypothetical protein